MLGRVNNRWLLGVAALLTPASVFAQAAVTIPNESTQPVLLEADGVTVTRRDTSLNIANNLFSNEDCINDRRIRYQLSNTNQDPTLPLEVWVSQNQDCTTATNRGGPNFLCWRGIQGSVPNNVQTEAILRIQDIAANNTGPTRAGDYVRGTREDCRNWNRVGFSIDFQFVRGAGIEGTGAKSSITLDTVGPEPPDRIALGVGEGLIQVRWTVPPQISDVTSYAIYCDSGNLSPIVTDDEESDAGDTTTDAGDTTTDAGVTDEDVEPTHLGLLQETDDTTTDDTTDTGSASSSGTTVFRPGTTTACPGEVQLREGVLPSNNWQPCARVTGPASNEVTVSGLKNDQPYAIAVVAYDQLGNPGPLSQVQCNTPVQTFDFFDNYRAAGGQAGCNAAGALSSVAPLTALTAVALACLRRRRRSSSDLPR